MTLTDPLISVLHTGQDFRAGAHWVQAVKWPHGKNTIDTVSSQHILHCVWSFISLFSSYISMYYTLHTMVHSECDISVCSYISMYYTLQTMVHSECDISVCSYISMYYTLHTMVHSECDISVCSYISMYYITSRMYRSL
jgi:hypothetical protein